MRPENGPYRSPILIRDSGTALERTGGRPRRTRPALLRVACSEAFPEPTKGDATLAAPWTLQATRSRHLVGGARFFRKRQRAAVEELSFRRVVERCLECCVEPVDDVGEPDHEAELHDLRRFEVSGK